MADSFEITHFQTLDETVLVELFDGRKLGTLAVPEVYFDIKPPLNENEHKALVKESDPDTKLGQLLVNGTQNLSGWLRTGSAGELNQEHFELGSELARAIITLRGIKGGRVAAAFDRNMQQAFITVKETTLPGQSTDGA